MIGTMCAEKVSQPSVMRTTAGGSGFVKQDVLKLIDELNVKMLALEDENNDLRRSLKAACRRIYELETANK